MSMAVQTSYNFGYDKGVAGGLYDLSSHEIATRQAEQSLTFGVGVVVGTNRGTDVALPTSASTAAEFEGVVVHNSVMVEKNMNNNVSIDDKRTVGCLQVGKMWVQTGKNANPVYKEQVYLITDGEEVGCFTTKVDTVTKVALNAYFLGQTDKGIANAMFNRQNAN